MKSRFSRIPKRRWVSHKGERLTRVLKREVSSSSEGEIKGGCSVLPVRARRDLKDPLVQFSHFTDKDNGAYKGYKSLGEGHPRK